MSVILGRRLKRLEHRFPLERVNAVQEILTQALLAIDNQDLHLLCDFLQRGSPYLDYQPAEKVAMERYCLVADAIAWKIAGKPLSRVGQDEYLNTMLGASEYLKYLRQRQDL
jgi:hypothetical protein